MIIGPLLKFHGTRDILSPIARHMLTPSVRPRIPAWLKTLTTQIGSCATPTETETISLS
jgi:hypothetical protein